MQRRFIRVRNFEKFQHYKHRSPTWIKLHVDLLQNEAFISLPPEDRYLLVGIWILASQRKNVLPAEPDWLAVELGLDSPPDITNLLRLQFVQWCSRGGDMAEHECGGGPGSPSPASQSASRSASRTASKAASESVANLLPTEGETETDTEEAPDGASCAELRSQRDAEAGADAPPDDTHALVDDPVVALIPLVGSAGEHPVRQSELDRYAESYPGIDVAQELRSCREWNLANPRNRKTTRGVRTHLASWLARAQNRAPRNVNGARHAPEQRPAGAIGRAEAAAARYLGRGRGDGPGPNGGPPTGMDPERR